MQYRKEIRLSVRQRWARAPVVALALVLGVGLALERGQRPAAPVAPESAAAAVVEAVEAAVALAPLATPVAAVPALEAVDPAQAGLDPAGLAGAVEAVRREVRRGAFPGAALVVGRGGRVVTAEGIGRTAWGGGEVDPAATLYDLASLTKVVATTTAVMLLVEDGAIELDAPVVRYLPDFRGGGKERVTVRHLLAHTSGLPAAIGVRGTPDEVRRRILATPLSRPPGQRVVYSDLGPIVLWAAAEAVTGEPLPELLERRVFGPLGMRSTRFRPELPCEACAPTAPDIRGRVHDPIARRLDGVAGNAGLFSTAEDLGRFAAMLAGGGELHGVRVLREETVRDFTRRQPGAGTRALGWDTPDPRGVGAAGRRISEHAFGHTGFTGTSMWIDPERGTWTVLLTNRTYEPKARNRIQAVRRDVHDQVASAADRMATDRMAE